MISTDKNITSNIIDDYLNGKTNLELSKKYNLHRGTIQRILIKNNINLRKQEITSRKHILLNENYFEIIDNQDKAYILGLIYADGNLYKGSVEISLRFDDKEILEKLSVIFYGKIRLGYRKEKMIGKYLSKPQYRLLIQSKKIYEDLLKIGLTPNKSLTIEFPKLREDMINHFIRGYFDGDGCLTFSENHFGNSKITMISNPSFCESLKIIISEKLKIKCYNRIKTNNVNDFQINGNNQIKKFLNWIYNDSNLKLDRKYKKYLIFNNIFYKKKNNLMKFEQFKLT